LTQWLHDARAGCPQARAKVLSSARSYLHDLARSGTRRAWQAKVDRDDLVQDVLSKFERKLDGLSHLSVRQLLAFLRRLLEDGRKDCQRRFRATKRAVGREQAWSGPALDGDVGDRVDSTALSPLEAMIVEEDLEWSAAALARLPDKERKLIVWHTKEGLSFAEIAPRLGCTEHAAQQKHTKALDRLRKAAKARG
jgi:RNA polymerase sigma factor (sigma-70 family)